jgi:CHASE3 domain sensor protein
VYAYCPTKEMNKYVTDICLNEYKNAIEKNANGKFYTGDISKMASNIMEEIKNTKISLMQTSEKRFIVDHPEIAVIITTICIFILIILEKWIKI